MPATNVRGPQKNVRDPQRHRSRSISRIAAFSLE
jgi:hypothetical protein